MMHSKCCLATSSEDDTHERPNNPSLYAATTHGIMLSLPPLNRVGPHSLNTSILHLVVAFDNIGVGRRWTFGLA